MIDKGLFLNEREPNCNRTEENGFKYIHFTQLILFGIH